MHHSNTQKVSSATEEEEGVTRAMQAATLQLNPAASEGTQPVREGGRPHDGQTPTLISLLRTLCVLPECEKPVLSNRPRSTMPTALVQPCVERQPPPTCDSLTDLTFRACGLLPACAVAQPSQPDIAQTSH
jgi:hypothetical protein